MQNCDGPVVHTPWLAGQLLDTLPRCSQGPAMQDAPPKSAPSSCAPEAPFGPAEPADRSPGWNLRRGQKDSPAGGARAGLPFKKGKDARRFADANADFNKLCREEGAKKAFDTVMMVMQDPGGHTRARFEAAKFILERSYGKMETKTRQTMDASGAFVEALRLMQGRPSIRLVGEEGQVVEDAGPVALEPPGPAEKDGA